MSARGRQSVRAALVRRRTLAVQIVALVVLFCALATGSALAIGISTAASEQGPIQVDLTSGVASRALQIDSLGPGGTSHHVLHLTTSATTAAEIGVGIRDVADVERLCLRPEVNAGDTTCGGQDGQGELSQTLLYAIDVAQPAGGELCGAFAQALAPRRLTDEGIISIGEADVTGAGRACVRIRVVLPFSSGNETQSDAVRFALVLVAEPLVAAAADDPPRDDDVVDPGSGPVAPEDGTDSGLGRGGTIGASRTGVQRPSLAVTGTQLAATVALGVMLILTGVVVRRLGVATRARPGR